MSLVSLLLGLSLLSPAIAARPDTTKASKPKPESVRPAPPPAKPAPKLEPRQNPQAKPLVPVGEPKLKRRKLPD